MRHKTGDFRCGMMNNAGEELKVKCLLIWVASQLFIGDKMQASTAKICLLASIILIATANGNLFMASENPSVDTYRAMVFAQTEERIKMLNEQYGEFYTSVHNQFSHLTPKEFAQTYLGGGMSPPNSVQRSFVGQPGRQDPKKKQLSTEGASDLQFNAGLLNSLIDETVQKSVDWSVATDSSPVLTTSVKNQGGCGSCWAFAGIAEIESYFLKKHKLWLDLSEQQMVDCLPAIQPGNSGCGGGYLDSVTFYSTQFPIAQQKFYPYTAVQNSCQTARISAGKTFRIKSYVYISDCLALANTLFNHKPVGVCGIIDSQWQNYGSGVVPNCDSPTKLGGHCVLLVGVKIDGTEANRNNKDENYWKIQNSWGTSWGERGFMRLFRDRTQTTGGVCGFCSEAIYSL